MSITILCSLGNFLLRTTKKIAKQAYKKIYFNDIYDSIYDLDSVILPSLLPASVEIEQRGISIIEHRRYNLQSRTEKSSCGQDKRWAKCITTTCFLFVAKHAEYSFKLIYKNYWSILQIWLYPCYFLHNFLSNGLIDLISIAVFPVYTFQTMVRHDFKRITYITVGLVAD